MLAGLWLCASALGAPVAEEIVVHGDPFARWDDTRWWVATEQTIPTGVLLGTDDANAFRSLAWQARAVVACSLPGRDRDQRRRVRCALEDVALQAATVDRWQRPSDRAEIDATISELEDALREVRVELVADARGAVVAVDVPQAGGVQASALRHISRQLLQPFHLRLPPGGTVVGRQWMSMDDPLIVVPDTLHTRSNITVVHEGAEADGVHVIQTVGAAQAFIVYDNHGGDRPMSPSDRAWKHLAPEGEEQEREYEVGFAMRLTSVAVYAPSDGYIRERAWVVAGLGVAGDLVLRVPFPTAPLFDDTQRVCLTVDLDLGVDDIELEDSGFRATCAPVEGGTRACLEVVDPERWPRRLAELVCTGRSSSLVMKPVFAFDPDDDISDGVQIARSVDALRAAFRTELPDAPGILAGGACGVTDGLLWMRLAPEPRRQACTLVVGEDEVVVPVRLVRGL